MATDGYKLSDVLLNDRIYLINLRFFVNYFEICTTELTYNQSFNWVDGLQELIRNVV
jgi:hypothetical protein